MEDEWEGANPLDEADLLKFLTTMREPEPWHATALLWTLTVGEMPLYVIRPEGPYARDAYDLLVRYYAEQLPYKRDEGEAGLGRIAVPGAVTGRATLYNAQPVPVINPDLRGLRYWSAHVLKDNARDKSGRFLPDFLDRVVCELRNAGRASRDRALNYVGTKLIQPARIFIEDEAATHTLDTIQVAPSTLSRPGSDCWDVTLAFFDPASPIQSVRSIYLYTVDVSEVIPVLIGRPRHWMAR
jgi:PatG C-terminal